MGKFTHFTMSGPKTGAIFALDQCETCERPTEAPNAMTHHENQSRMIRSGFKQLGARLPEIWWDDDVGGCVCERSDCKTFLQSSEADNEAAITEAVHGVEAQLCIAADLIAKSGDETFIALATAAQFALAGVVNYMEGQ